MKHQQLPSHLQGTTLPLRPSRSNGEGLGRFQFAEDVVHLGTKVVNLTMV